MVIHFRLLALQHLYQRRFVVVRRNKGKDFDLAVSKVLVISAVEVIDLPILLLCLRQSST